MKHCKAISLILLLALALSLFAGCGGESGTSQPASEPQQGSTGGTVGTEIAGLASEGEGAGTATVEEAAGSVQRDVINIGVQADITDWAPWASGGVGRNHAIWGLYQPLIDFDSGNYIPVLLKDYSFSDDGLLIDCELWDFIVDSAGNPLKADDVIFSYARAVEVFPQFDEMYSEIEKTGDYTFTFHMRRPMQVGEMKDLFTSPVITQASYEADGNGMHNNPIGTGPYIRTSYTSGYSFTYEKNPNYWETEESLRQARDMANVNTINWYVISESAQRTLALEQGTIDMCGAISNEDLAKFDGQNGYQLFSYPDNLSMILFPNCDASSPCSDLNLRLAICYSISSEAVLQSVYGGNGTAMFSEVPNWAKGYNTAWETEDNYYHYNVDTAKQYLAQSNYNNETLRILCASDERSVNTAQLINNFLTQIGVNSEVNSYESSVFTEYMKQADKWDILLKTQPTSSGFYAQTLHSDLSKTRTTWGGTMNFVFDDELQDLILTCMTEATSTQENIDALQKCVADNCYAMGLVNYYSFVVVPDTVTSLCLSYRKTVMPGGCAYSG